MNNTKKESDFRLHISAEQKPKNTGFSKNIWAILKYLLTSFIILVLLYVFANFQALYQIASFKIEEMFSDNTTELQEPDISVNTEDVLLESYEVYEESTNAIIPNLEISIAPLTNRIIIPRIKQNVPVVTVSSENLISEDWDALENDIQEALRSGVVHYPGTSLPGDGGNVVITGHSSYFIWDPGRFKDVFALLHDVVEGDMIQVYYNQELYDYEVSEIFIVDPEDIEVLLQTDEEVLTLITCTPIGTNARRLIVKAKPLFDED